MEISETSAQRLRKGFTALQDLQASFDRDHFTGAAVGASAAKRRHIGFHITILAAKLARVEERTDHGSDDAAILTLEVIPDLLIYATQLSLLLGIDLTEQYLARLEALTTRYMDDDPTNMGHPDFRCQ